MLVDSHCHLDRLNLEKYNGNLDKAVEAAQVAGVSKMLCVGIDLEHADQIIEMTEQYLDVYGSVGVHPLEDKARTPELDELLRYAAHEKIVAIGETGLDYYYSKENKLSQQQRFALHLQAAGQIKLPVIVHTRDAREDTLAMIRQHANLESAGVLHCFTESWEMAKAAMDMNFMISISGIVTFKNAKAIREVAKKLPIDRLLIETDSPYLAPVPHRGKPNEPAFVADVARFIADLRGISFEELTAITADNFHTLFNKCPH
ncbi:MAG: TatD family hydrolase [Endozoicomonas sp. (ex Botrylloides leachii)]|nr:TatD family hydrolase [Endozoicomonas sp. (ex Botrylloides leachii)]